MQQYELIEILDPSLTADAVKAHVERVDGLIGRLGGSVLRRQDPHRRRLGHAMKKNPDGVYCVVNFTAPTAGMKELTRVLNLDQETLRHVATRYIPPKPKAPKAGA